eukprot:CAMPEP_0170495074 /NCGR_PEP_ID=MMETSP0208-20121228/15002_1 /TAXON_ID=197538 /ORGANISM="Strombidium inclinatum, Strain S3" /LENGTH=57 /DNA_ID=CAMNT_0010771213 /DNA_START=386 /DNA_END=559 /DNA_ORIENTATION=-
MSSTDQHATRISLALETGSYQLPSIFFGQEHIGGFDDLKSYFQVPLVADKLMSTNGV